MDDRDGLVDRLRAELGAELVVTDPDVLATAAVDWTGRFRSSPRCLVRPRSTEDVSLVVQACAATGVPITPQGGNTGLVGGAVPPDGGVVLSTTGLDRLDEVDHNAGTVVAGAGITLSTLQRHAEDAGWAFGVDLASRDSATVGGMVATDAGGARVVLHGSMRAQVVGLEVVLADGSTATPWFTGVAKDAAGYHLAHLLVGSEGTLGIVTAARLRLVRPVSATAVLLVGVAEAQEVASTVAATRQDVAASDAVLTACELLSAEGLALTAEHLGVPVPVATPFALLVELGGDVDDDLLVRLAGHASGGGGDEPPVVAGLDEADRRRLWALREEHTEAIGRLGVPVKLDVAVPTRQLGALLTRAPVVVEEAVEGATTVLFGHAAEANVHVNVVLPDTGATDAEAGAAAVEDAVLELVAGLGGTVSAEHGIGREKVRHLGRTRDSASIAAMRAIKHALDPTGVFNPGVVLAADEDLDS